MSDSVELKFPVVAHHRLILLRYRCGGQADVRARYAATGEKAVLAGVPEEDREFVTGIWPPEFERILNGESASMLAQDAQLGKL